MVCNRNIFPVKTFLIRGLGSPVTPLLLISLPACMTAHLHCRSPRIKGHADKLRNRAPREAVSQKSMLVILVPRAGQAEAGDALKGRVISSSGNYSNPVRLTAEKRKVFLSSDK